MFGSKAKNMQRDASTSIKNAVCEFKTTIGNRAKGFFNKENSYLLYCFFIPVVLFFLIYVSMGLYPIKDGSVLVLDLNGQYVYFYEALRNAVMGDTSLLYSFARQLGGEFMGIYAYYVASPFSYIVCLFPQENILEALLCIFLLKSGISGFTMGYYLSKTSKKLNRTNAVICSVLYSMCAYAVVQQHNSMWIDALMWLPLLTLGIEELIKNYKYKLFVVMLALILMSNFYIGYMACIYTAVYFFYYYFAHNQNDENNPKKETMHLAKSLLRIIVFAIIGIGISMVIVATAYYSLQFGKNEFSNPNFSFSMRFDLIDFFTKFYPGSYDTVRPEGLPFVYCGVLTLFAVPLYFFSKKFSTREKAWSAGILFFFVLSFAINTLDMVWHGFQKPNWLNYRYSFMFCFLLIVMAYKGLSQIRRASTRTIGFIGAFLALFIAVAQKFTFHAVVERISGKVQFDQEIKDLEVVWFSILCILAFAVLLCIMIKTKRKQTCALIMLMFVCIEAFGSGVVHCVEFGNDVIYSSYSSYNNFVGGLRPLTEAIMENDPSFFRYEKNVHRKYCDNMALNIRGLTNSTSTLNKETIQFLTKMGYASKSHWSKYLGGTPLNDSLLGIKYIIDKEDSVISEYYDILDLEPAVYNNAEYYAFVNDYALSLAYAVDDDLLDYEFDGDTPMENLNGLMSAMLGEDEVLEFYVPVTDYETSTTNLSTKSTSSYIEYRPENSSLDAVLTYTFTASKGGEYYFYLPSDYPREVTLKVNNKSNGTFYGGETTRIVSLGILSEGQTVNVSMTLNADVLYVTPKEFPIYTLDMDLTKTSLNSLAEQQLIVSDDWSDDHIKGSLTTKEDATTILTTLPYDEGWKVYVDGKAVEYEKTLDALIAFNIDNAGKHNIEFRYLPTSFTLGLTITILSILIFIFVMIFEKQIYAACAHITAEVEVKPSEENEEDIEPDEEVNDGDDDENSVDNTEEPTDSPDSDGEETK